MSDPIKALILTHNYPRYKGDFSGVFLELLARRLPEHGVLPIILAPHDEKAADRETFGEVEIHRFRYENDESKETLAYRGDMHRQVLSDPKGWLRLRSFLKHFEQAAVQIIEEYDVDVLAGHWLVPTGLVLRSLAGKNRLPIVLSSHGSDLRLLKRVRLLAGPYLSRLFHRMYRWTVVSTYLKEIATNIYPSVQDRIEVLPLPHDETLFIEDRSIKREDSLIVSVPLRFSKQKRVLSLVRAFKEVREVHPEARLVLYGFGLLEVELNQLIDLLSLTGYVSIKEQVPHIELPSIYNRAAMVVLNSFEEGFGRMLSEAMMCGAPAIGTRSGGITDIIEHEKTGLLVEVDNESELAAAMLRMLKDSTLRSRLAKAGHESAVRRFASGPLAARYAELLREAAGSQTR